jgi:2',3'-cyclic-nucleotide 2'-phosphodiesterase (5'-nucleotidase family)
MAAIRCKGRWSPTSPSAPRQAGARYYYSNLRVTPLSIGDNLPVRDDETYTLATNDYLAEGGDGLMLLSTLPREALGVLLLDAVVTHLRTLPTPVTFSSPP